MTSSNKTPSGEQIAFDFAALERKIVAASLEAFREVARAHPGESVCAFALYSDDGAMTVCPAFDLAARRAARIANAKDQDEVDSYTFAPAEWALEGFGGQAFKDICTEVRTWVLDEVGDLLLAFAAVGEAFVAFRAQLFETCVRALERLRGEGAFDAYPDLLVLFAVSDSDPVDGDEVRMLERLNGESPYVAQFLRWTERWAND